MWRQLHLGIVALFCAAAFSLSAPSEQDRDGDGLLDREEEILGSDPMSPDRFATILEDGEESEAARGRSSYDASKDFIAVESAHVGENRFLWRVRFAADPRSEDTVLHLYVDADTEEETGRKAAAGGAVAGTDYMLSIVGGQGRATRYNAEGNTIPGPVVRFVVQDKAMVLSADVDLARGGDSLHTSLYVLCHTISESGQSPAMSDASPKRAIEGVVLTDRKKPIRAVDFSENHRVGATFGESLLQSVELAEGTVVVPHDKLQCDGFEVDLFTSNRWPHVSRQRPDGKVWTQAPKSGRYHVGFMMYDDSNDERVGVFIEGKLEGVAVARQDNNRTWLYWLEQPYDFQGGERVQLEAIGPAGKHGICNILFLAETPEVRRIEYRVENMTSAAHVGRAGLVTISWTTTWPSPTRFEYGTDSRYGQSIEEENTCLVHRVVLDGLDPSREYHGRAVGTSSDGSAFAGSDFVFRALPPDPPQTVGGVHDLPLSVRNPHKFEARRWPITTGIPFPRATLASESHVRLLLDGEEVPVQVQLTARWTDGSVKWILVTFLADIAAESEREYRLQYGREIGRATVSEEPALKQDGEGVTVDTGAIRFRIDSRGQVSDLARGGRPVFTPAGVCETVAIDAKGKTYTSAAGEADLTVEESGPIRTVVKSVSDLKTADGPSVLRLEQRVEAYRGLPWLRVYHTVVVTGEEKFLNLKQLSCRLPVATAGRTWQAPLVDGQVGKLSLALPCLLQRFDNELVSIAGDKETPLEGRAIGSIFAEDGDGCAIAVRDLWQNYPKGFTLQADGLNVDLCPAFPAGLYDQFPFEKEGHHLYYYLLDGVYKLKQGVSKTHEILLCFDSADRNEAVAELFQRPLLATAPPEWYCASKVFYDVAPRNPEKFKLYEEAIDKNLQSYIATCERQRDYGLMNFGDWYGERGVNWGNIEYDTQHAFFLEYIRSGNPAAFFLGNCTELHNRDIDTVHFSADPHDIGAVYVHQMGHVGGYHDKSVPGTLGIPSAGFSISHAWAEGHFDHYFLTGDRRSYDTGCAVSDLFIRKELSRPYDFLSCRVPGWHLIMLAAAYAATGDPYYLNAARVIIDRVLETQDTAPRPLAAYQAVGRKPYQQGGWSRMMVPGHCQCEPRHRGNANFMVAVLLAGMKYYHDVTEDPRVKESIIQGAHYLIEECYSDETHGFRYTSCPNTRYTSGASPLMVEGVARAYLWTKDERFRRVLTEALPRGSGGSGYGKGFSMYYRMAPRVLADLDAAGLTLNEPAEAK